jgi:ADP-heptose:LPS heptosyltransferase
VITSDSFIMHAAHLPGVPTVVLWGPTKPELYGYGGQIHLKGPLEHCPFRDQCIGGRTPQNYGSPCPLGKDNHCIDKIPMTEIIDAVEHFF